MTGSRNGPGDGGIILFDGVCNLCERSVQFVIRHDPNAMFLFAPLQSDFARTLIEDPELGLEELRDGNLDSFVDFDRIEAVIRERGMIPHFGLENYLRTSGTSDPDILDSITKSSTWGETIDGYCKPGK